MPIDITREVKNITKNKVQILSIMLTGGEDITKLHSREAANSTLLPTVTVVYDYVPRTNTVPTKEPPVTKPPPLGTDLHLRLILSESNCSTSSKKNSRS